MPDERTYSPVEICNIFSISKSTLLRWEREGFLIGVKRDIKSGERMYSGEHVKAISQRQIGQLGKQYSASAEVDDLDGLMKIHEMSALRKVIQGNMIGLTELENLSLLSSDGIRQLVQIATEQYEPADPSYWQILKVASKQSRKLSSKEFASEAKA